MKTIVLGGGCFWCIEAVYQQVNGVSSVNSGYSGGTTEDPTYDAIGDHAEVVQISYDESVVSLDTLLDIFFYVHDPTTLNRQGNDIGTQYRSIVLCSESEVQEVKNAKQRASELWQDPIVTEIKVLDTFYVAEEYHQDYYSQNQNNPYCQVVINPKLASFRKTFAEYLR